VNAVVRLDVFDVLLGRLILDQLHSLLVDRVLWILLFPVIGGSRELGSPGLARYEVQAQLKRQEVVEPLGVVVAVCDGKPVAGADQTE
jgi:hypothetical protein